MKDDNILVRRGMGDKIEAKLMDFGMCGYLGDQPSLVKEDYIKNIFLHPILWYNKNEYFK